MSDELDPVLLRLFAKSASPDAKDTSAPDLAVIVLARVAQSHRRRRLTRGLVLIACLLAAAAVTPYAVRASVAFGQSATDGFAAFGQMLVSPAGFSASLAVATLWVLRRARLRRVASSRPPGLRGSAPGK
jgi:hypothetical protein